MNEYALRASIGDDVYFDGSTTALEAHIAMITGKEAGLFLPWNDVQPSRSTDALPAAASLCHHRCTRPYLSVSIWDRSRTLLCTHGGLGWRPAVLHSTRKPTASLSFPRMVGSDKIRTSKWTYSINLLGHHLTWEDIEPRIVSGTNVHV